MHSDVSTVSLAMLQTRLKAALGFCLCLLSSAAYAVQPSLPLPVAEPPTSGFFDLATPKDSIALIHAPWLFQRGDDPDGSKGWASPSFDDSKWESFDAENPRNDQRFTGMAWFRMKIHIPANESQLSIMMGVLTSAEVFVDGKLVRTMGYMPPHEQPTLAPFRVADFPVLDASQPHTVTLSLRVWQWRRWTDFDLQGGPQTGVRIGQTLLIHRLYDRYTESDHWAIASYIVLSAIQVAAAFTALGLFAVRRREREYLWFVLALLFAASTTVIEFCYDSFELNTLNYDLLYAVAVTANCIALLAFFMRLLAGKRNNFFWISVGFLGVYMALSIATWIDVPYAPLLAVWKQDSLAPLNFWILWLLIRRAYQNFPDARYLLLPVFLNTIFRLAMVAVTFGTAQGFNSSFLAWFNISTQWPFPIYLPEVVDLLFLAGMLAILIRRFNRTSSEQERYAAEVDGARRVQQYLIPDDLPQIPGLTIESDYRPAREVGGDFFQIIPNSDGSALVFVGDVAGKGMQAGMLATLLVGAMRTAATFTRDPAVILATLNNRLHARGNATCLALSIAPSGAVTLVNAGHLPPYRNGIELPMEGALPLGTIPNLDFPQMQFNLDLGDTLTLMTDGVLEAQKPSGELFGFDRISESLRLSTSARTLAQAAQSFGQSELADDITVLTISRS